MVHKIELGHLRNSNPATTAANRYFIGHFFVRAAVAAVTQEPTFFAPMVPHFEHSMIDPYSATGQPSGHWSTATKALCRHFGHDTASLALCMLLRVLGSLGFLRRGPAIR
jgi:hypothetical protein